MPSPNFWTIIFAFETKQFWILYLHLFVNPNTWWYLNYNEPAETWATEVRGPLGQIFYHHPMSLSFMSPCFLSGENGFTWSLQHPTLASLVKIVLFFNSHVQIKSNYYPHSCSTLSLFLLTHSSLVPLSSTWGYNPVMLPWLLCILPLHQTSTGGAGRAVPGTKRTPNYCDFCLSGVNTSHRRALLPLSPLQPSGRNSCFAL